jgi:hypothetical protein
MLKVQEYLQTQTLSDLEAELGINSVRHPTIPLVILNYDQIKSKKTHPIVRECRGLVLEDNSWQLVARAFFRFFNWGEVADEMPLFDFSNFSTLTKEDGSNVILFNYKGKWHANTRGSFGHLKLEYTEYTWRQAFCQALGINDLDELKLDPSLTYVCEFCSPYNKVVRRYPTPTMYLLTVYQGEQELSLDAVNALYVEIHKSGFHGFNRPMSFNFSSIDQIVEFLKRMSEDDPSFEGVVICDHKFMRWKVKNPTYLSLHQLRGEGDNLFNPKYLLPFVLGGNTDELFTYFEETRPTVEKMQEQIKIWQQEVDLLWVATKPDDTQKEYALRVKEHPLSSVLFQARKLGRKPSQLFQEFSDVLLKHLK